ncbi:MAG: hypothetical protein IJ716_10440 [Lachnospiraceae bacterium]|nr:hypothetical protein [Lachnospiraceae bacterium]
MGLLHHGKLMVGFDLGEEYSQISYTVGEDVETLSTVAGEGRYNIPTVLCKRIGANQWSYGKEALLAAQDDDRILVEDILQLAVNGEPVQIDGNAFDPVSLLALYVKRSLGLLSQVASPDKIYAMTITCERLDSRMVAVLDQVVESLQFRTDKIFYQSHAESFYHYMIKQPEELWKAQVLLLEYRGTKVHTYCMGLNRHTTPVVAYVENWEYNMPPYEPMPEEEELRREKMERLDQEFTDIATQVCKRTPVTSVYLIGEHYSNEWMKESLKNLCMGRRVFQGNNLYSKGACYAVTERFQPSEIGKAHVFLGEEKLKSNIGMHVLQQGQETYYALLDAGVNWYEAEHTVEFYMRGGNELELEIISLTGKENTKVPITLEDMLPGMSRMRAHLFLTGEKNLVVEIEDLGFGSFRAATGQIWHKEIAL